MCRNNTFYYLHSETLPGKILIFNQKPFNGCETTERVNDVYPVIITVTIHTPALQKHKSKQGANIDSV
jgi:hypothetical protein